MKLKIIAACLIAATPTFADNRQVASDVGSILGAAPFCDLVLDEGLVLGYLDTQVDASDLSFPERLGLYTQAGARAAKAWTGIEKAAQCRAIENAARAAGFIE